MHLLVHFAIDWHVFTDGFLLDRFDEIINGAQGAHGVSLRHVRLVILARPAAI